MVNHNKQRKEIHMNRIIGGILTCIKGLVSNRLYSLPSLTNRHMPWSERTVVFRVWNRGYSYHLGNRSLWCYTHDANPLHTAEVESTVVPVSVIEQAREFSENALDTVKEVQELGLKLRDLEVTKEFKILKNALQIMAIKQADKNDKMPNQDTAWVHGMGIMHDPDHKTDTRDWLDYADHTAACAKVTLLWEIIEMIEKQEKERSKS